jgi:aspartyl/asparaginyl beta-hydroxylase (cupin superfamily)
VKIAPHSWTVQDFRDLNKYMGDVISKVDDLHRACLWCKFESIFLNQWATGVLTWVQQEHVPLNASAHACCQGV